MAIYNKLSLGAGGGIISRMQQADQAENTANVLIGLGGTGIDAIRHIKTQVYSRLLPDDPEAVVPTYKHIRFLGVDTDENQCGDAAAQKKEDGIKADALRALDQTEYFPISNPRIKQALQNKTYLELKDELAWLNWEEMPIPNFGKAGAGGIRQVGRYMMMDKSSQFMERVRKEINAAKTGLQSPKVNVHIFSGLSGGTGAGCFLDVCYMVRHLMDTVGQFTLFGYFYLPDVNLSRITDTETREYVPKNGYASMQELDYCMQLQFNGGKFTQEYKDNKLVEWHEPPVDMCHLICATNGAGDVIEGAYDYAMNVTSEYLMDFLTYSDAAFGLEAQHSNFVQKVIQGDTKKRLGANLSYCVIGASCASIPMREINTYLASELFHKFSQICGNVPTKGDVELMAVDALAPGAGNVSHIYAYLRQEMCAGFEMGYSPYPQRWRDVLKYGNDDIVTHYTDQKAEKLNIAERNAKAMMDSKNQKALISRIRSILTKLIRNIDYGPMYAYRMLEAGQHNNLLNVIDGIIEENNQKWGQESAQSEDRKKDYDRSLADFKNQHSRGFLDNDSKRFNDYHWYLQLRLEHQLELELYAKLDTILNTLRKQVVEAAASYYVKLNRVMTNLVDTFKENRDALASEKILQDGNSFVMRMMTIKDMKPTLDARIEELNIPGMMEAFMDMLLEHEAAWLAEDENQIAKMVNTFFVKEAFEDFANRNITAFLKDKYKANTDAELMEKVYNEWMTPLTEKARPLFSFNSNIWPENPDSQLAFVSIPDGAVAIGAAADKMAAVDSKWRKKKSALIDRIYIMCNACALPLSAYNELQEYERMYFNSISATSGIHYYEGKPAPGMLFTEWRKLPSLIPLSHAVLNNAPPVMLALFQEAAELYDKAKGFGIIDENSKICEPSPAGVKALEDLMIAGNQLLGHLSKRAEVPEAKKLVAALEQARKVPMVATQYLMRNDGNGARPEVKQRVQKDYFVASPAYQILARQTLEGMETRDTQAEELIQKIKKKIEFITIGSRAIEDYLDALFTGVIKLEGLKISYTKMEEGIATETVVLSRRHSDFPFNLIPPYQGFKSYETLLDTETKASIKQQVDALYEEDDPQILQTGRKLKEALADNKFQAWRVDAEEFAEQAEILSFIITLKKRFTNFCMRNGID